MAELIVVSGYALGEEEYLFSDEAVVPEPLLRHPEFWAWLCEFTKQPQPLSFCCRRRVHASLGRRTVHSAPQLPLPTRLQNFVLMRDSSFVD